MAASGSIFGGGADRWYKGILHCHSTESDGRKPPEAVVQWYKQRGYDFLSLTDHRTVTEVRGDDEIVCIRGVELNTNDVRPGRAGLYHVLGIGVSADCDCRVDDDPQRLIDAILAAGGLAIVAHPKWSGNLVDEEFLALKGHIGVECYNYASEIDNHTGLGDIHWDMLSLSGRRLFGFATDDSHSLEGDAGGGWVMVRAEEKSEEAILEAIRRGRFYSSGGPRVYDVSVQDGKVTVECSPAIAVHFMTGGPPGLSVRAKWDGWWNGLVERAEYELRGTERFVRVEVVDTHHRTAWTHPIDVG